MKKTLAFLLSLCMMLSLVPAPVFADEADGAQPEQTVVIPQEEAPAQNEESAPAGDPAPAQPEDPAPAEDEGDPAPAAEPQGEEPTAPEAGPQGEEPEIPAEGGSEEGGETEGEAEDAEPEEGEPEEQQIVITLKKLKDVRLEGGYAQFKAVASCSAEGAVLEYQWQSLDTSVTYRTDDEREAAWKDIRYEDKAALEFEGVEYETYENTLFRCRVSACGVAVYTDEVRLLPEEEATEPEATEPEAAEPEAAEPEVTEPEATEPEATEPAEGESEPEEGESEEGEEEPEDGEEIEAEITGAVPDPESVAIEQGEAFTADLGVCENMTVQLTAVVYPDGAVQDVTWKTSDKRIATVDEQGLVTFKKAGTVTVTATAAGTKLSAKCKVTGTFLVHTLEIKGSGAVATGKSVTLSAAGTPANASNKKVTWSVSDTALATISTAGKLTAKKVPGTVTVTATAKDGSGVTATKVIEILPAAAKVTIAGGLNIDFNDPEPWTTQLSAAIEPAEASQAVTWKSSSAKVATVDENGLVTFLKAGSVTVTATATDGTGKSAKATVKLSALVTGLEISGPDTVAAGKSVTLKAAATPENAANKKVTWSVSDKSIATVSSTGKVTAAKKLTEISTVTVTATAQDGSGVTATYFMTVLPAASKVVIGGETNVDFNLAHTTQLTAAVEPADASQGVTWKSSSAKVATVDENGLVTFLKTGSVTITATATDGTGKSAKVTVKGSTLVTALEITGPDKVAAGKSVTLKTAAAPEDATNKKVTWSVSDKSVATVSTAGKVTASKKLTQISTVTVTATAQDGSGVEATYDVTVVPAAAKVTVTGDTNIDLNLTEQTQLTAAIEPADASQAVTWKSSSTKIATVDENGLVTFLKAGTVTITATATDGTGKSAKVTVKASCLVTGIEIEGPAVVNVPGSLTLKANVKPDNAANKSVTWSVSDKSIATVSTAGKLTAKKPGTVTVTAEAKDGSGVSASYSVLVLPKGEACTGIVAVEVEPREALRGGKVALRVTTEPTAVKLELYDGGAPAAEWNADSAEIYGNCAVWNVEYAFTTLGEKELALKIENAAGSACDAYDAGSVWVRPESGEDPAILWVSFGKALAGEDVAVTLMTDASVNYLYMYEGETLLKTFVRGESDVSGDVWTLGYTFETAGTRRPAFRASKDGVEKTDVYTFGAVTIGQRPPVDFVQNGDTLTVDRYTGTGGEVTLPATYRGCSVTAVANDAFKGSAVTKVTLPVTVTSIGASAFEGCTSLKSVVLSDNVSEIGRAAFKGCSSLSSMTIDNG